MRKTERKQLKRSWKAERKAEKTRQGNYGMFQSKMPQENVGNNETSRSTLQK